jgi:hypothetical protein
LKITFPLTVGDGVAPVPVPVETVVPVETAVPAFVLVAHQAYFVALFSWVNVPSNLSPERAPE